MLKNWKKNHKSWNRDFSPVVYSSIIFKKITELRPRFHIYFLSIILIHSSSFAQNCNPDILFKTNFQKSESQPSNGNRGIYPGAFNRTVIYNGKIMTYYVSIPPDYNPKVASPMLITWHGAAGAGTAPSNAKAMRDFWKPTADVNNFIVVAQAATGQLGGGWLPSNDFPTLSQVLADMFLHYNIEKTRIYGHGFSSGGHVMHGLMLQNSEYFAAYVISAGVLEAFAGTSAPFNAKRRIPVFVSIGNRDTTGPNLLDISRQNHTVFNNAGWVDNDNYWIDEFSGGHQIDNNLPQKSWDKICAKTNFQ